jgi:hypothetical protein
MVTPVRLIAHGGVVSDAPWLAAKGFDEAGLVVYNGEYPSSAFIHNAGIKYATLNPFNDSGDPPGSNGDHYAGYMQTIKNAGWDMVAGEGRGGDNIRVVNNYRWYVNYGGIVGDPNCGNQWQADMYASPWFHPKNGAHLDYIEIYDNCKRLIADSCIASMKAAWQAGAVEVGILVGVWMAGHGVSSQTLIGIIDKARSQGIPCNNVAWWCGYRPNDVVAALKSSGGETGCAEQLNGIINHYGVRHGIGSTGGGGGGVTPTPATPQAHIWYGTYDSKSLYTQTVDVGATMAMQGIQGFTLNGAWIPVAKLTAAEKSALLGLVTTYQVTSGGTVQTPTVTTSLLVMLYFIGCPHAANQLSILKQLHSQYPQITIETYDVDNIQEKTLAQQKRPDAFNAYYQTYKMSPTTSLYQGGAFKRAWAPEQTEATLLAAIGMTNVPTTQKATTTQINRVQPKADGGFSMALTHKTIETVQYYTAGATGNKSDIITVKWVPVGTAPKKDTPVTPVTPDTGATGTTPPVTTPDQPQDVTLLPVEPIPSPLTEGLTIVLRDHKKKKT